MTELGPVAYHPDIAAALTHPCDHCSATPGQHCRPYDRNRIVHPNRGKETK